MASSSLPLSLAFFFFFSSHLPNALQPAGGFSVDLIHRDSPRSPFYNPLDTVADRIARAVSRSNSRINYVRRATSSASPNDVTSTVQPSGGENGEYLMDIALGTPPVKILAIADTGSDLIWAQCSPCPSCYKQDAPLFDPKDSSTYRDVSCSSDACALLPQSQCAASGSCQYAYSYEDQSHTIGNLAAETLTMTSSGSSTSVQFPNVLFGCGHDNNGTFDSHGAGLVGLGGWNLSLISQLSSTINGKFSYCLVPILQTSSSSRMEFGDSAIVSGQGTVSTPLIPKTGSKSTYYFVSLLKITVGENSISVPKADQRNFIVDSGATFTYLPSSVYDELVSAVKDSIKLPPAQSPSRSFELCYEFGADDQVPDLKFGFDGAEISLKQLNTFVKVIENVSCFAFFSASDTYTIGNIAQQNFKVGYDLKGSKLSFQPTNCAQQ